MTIEQRINIKFCVKLGITATETLKMLRNVYGDFSMSRTRTSTTDTNFEKVRQLVCSYRRLTTRVIASKVGMDKETVRTILVDTLGMRKVCAKMCQGS